ncbi:hypothetical protein RA307_13125 [Xanthobacteraceae bacterium Astr-EGSB]|uniref:hypothetical protein n=1 Tax=Astrobacterium formosum TaxID=3069710 RepID=UPI0027B0F0C4|nr:hypothetical protein [Xanthobacteraceae bacterium Astr-EGSB]
MERRGNELVLIFTPDGRTYTFQIDGERLRGPTCSQAGKGANDHEEAEVRRMATAIAKLALAEGTKAKN